MVNLDRKVVYLEDTGELTESKESQRFRLMVHRKQGSCRGSGGQNTVLPLLPAEMNE